MRALVLAFINGLPANARDTVETETPATFASSSILAVPLGLGSTQSVPKVRGSVVIGAAVCSLAQPVEMVGPMAHTVVGRLFNWRDKA